MTHNLHLLAELPLPLATGKRRLHSAVDYIALDAAPLQHSTFHPTNNQPDIRKPCLVTARNLQLSEQDWENYKAQNKLLHLHHDIWVSPSQPITRAIRAESLAMIAPTDYLHRIRFSRLSAAWVLGYSSQLAKGRIDIDYSRDNRCNLPRAYRALFAPHQTTVIPYDCISIGSIKVTTPLRTAVDLISYHDDVEHLNAVRAILQDPQNTVTPQLFLKVLTDKPNLRRSSYLRAEHLAREAFQELSKNRENMEEKSARQRPRKPGRSTRQTQ